MIWARFLKSLTKTGVAALALAALATVGNASEVYKGKFTLAVKTQWGDVTLPAGNYTFAMPSTNSPYTPVLFVNDSLNALTSGSIDLTLSVVFGEKLRFPPSNPKP
jgi:hypothetical protein